MEPCMAQEGMRRLHQMARRARSSQGGVSMIETMLVLTLTAVILIPVFGWMAVALAEQGRTGDRISDVSSVGPARLVFSRDLASAASATTSGADCVGGPGAGGAVKLTLVSSTTAGKRTVYSEAPMVKRGSVSATTNSLWRRTCDSTGSIIRSDQVLVGLGSPVTVSCASRGGVPSPDPCGQVRVLTTTARSSDPVSLSGSRRWTGSSVAVSLGGGKQAPVPVISSTQSDPSGYRNLTVDFSSAGSSDPDGTIVSYFWDFGNGQTSTAANPSVTYTAVGVFPVSLTVTDNDGAPRTAYTSVTVRNRNPVAVIANDASTLIGNKPLTVAFSSAGSNDSADPGGYITSYHWSFGDGGESTQPNPTHTYTLAGTFSVSLTVTDNDTGTTTVSRDVVVKNVPPVVTSVGWTCQVGITPCASGVTNSVIGTAAPTLATSFTAAATDPDGGSVTDWEWSVSPSATVSNANAQSPSISFPSAGSYVVTLKVKDNDGAWSTPQSLVVKVNSPPSALFSKSLSNPDGFRPLSVSLDASSSSDLEGPIASYSWSTNDGLSATGSTATLTWPPTQSAGTRTITLTVADGNGAIRQTSQTVTLVNRPPVAALATTPDPASGPKPLTVTFDAGASNDPDGTGLTYAWKVNGSSVAGATSSTYVRTFTTTAAATVSVTVTDIDGATATKTVSVTPGNLVPLASFSFPCHASVPTQYCAAGISGSVIGSIGSAGTFAAVFTGSGDDSADGGSISAYEWTVSPSASISSSGASAPTITFNSAGVYAVAFRVRDNDGTWSAWLTKTVVVNSPPSVSATLPSGGRAPLTNKTFSGSVSDPEGTTTTATWKFEGTTTFSVSGATINQGFPTPGTWTVTLTATDAHGGITTTTGQVFTVTGAPPPTISGVGSGCQGFWCLGSRYIDINFSNKPSNVDKFELTFSGGSVVCGAPANVEVASSANSKRVSTGCAISYTYQIRVRSHDSVTGLWGDWSDLISVTT